MIDQVRLAAEAAAWIGTPFAIGAQIRGVGVDCVRLAAALLEAHGVLAPGDEWPAYTAQGGGRDASQLRKWFADRAEHWQLLPGEAEPRAGDVVLFRVGKVEHHAGVVIAPPIFVHALPAAGVVEGHLGDSTWTRKSRLAGIARPLE